MSIKEVEAYRFILKMILRAVLRHRKITWKGSLPKRLPRVKFVYAPSFYVDRREAWGVFNLNSRIIKVAVERNPEERRLTLVHEFTHYAEFVLTGKCADGTGKGRWGGQYCYSDQHCEKLARGVATSVLNQIPNWVWRTVGL